MINGTEKADAAALSTAAKSLYSIGLLLLVVLGLAGAVGGLAVMSNSGIGGFLVLTFTGAVIWLLYLTLVVSTRVFTVLANISVNGIELLSELKTLGAKTGNYDYRQTLAPASSIATTQSLSSDVTSRDAVKPASNPVGVLLAGVDGIFAPEIQSNTQSADPRLDGLDSMSELELEQLGRDLGISISRSGQGWRSSISNGLALHSKDVSELRDAVRRLSRNITK